MEAAFEDFVLSAPRVEKYPQYCIYTDVTEGGLGLHGASWAGLCALIHQVQRALSVPHRPMPKRTNSSHLPHIVEKYRTILLSFGMEMGHLPRSGQPADRRVPKRTHDDLESLFDDEDCRLIVDLSPLSPTSTSNPRVPRLALVPCNPTLCNHNLPSTGKGNPQG